MTIPKVSVTRRAATIFDAVQRWEINGEPSPIQTLQIHLTGYCNANCQFCWYKSGFQVGAAIADAQLMAVAQFCLSTQVKSVVISGGGEPTLHPKFASFVNSLIDSGVRVGVITNGLYSSSAVAQALSRCTWVKFSLHASNKEDHAKLMGLTVNSFSRILSNFASLVECGIPTPGIGCVVTKDNQSDECLLRFAEFGVSIGAQRVLYKPVIDFPSLEPTRDRAEFMKLRGTIKSICEAGKAYTNYHTMCRDLGAANTSSISKCYSVRSRRIIFVDYTGAVYPCLPLGQRKAIKELGNLGSSSFSEILNSKPCDPDVGKCPFCAHQKINELLERHLSSNSKPAPSVDPHMMFLP